MQQQNDYTRSLATPYDTTETESTPQDREAHLTPFSTFFEDFLSGHTLLDNNGRLVAFAP